MIKVIYSDGSQKLFDTLEESIYGRYGMLCHTGWDDDGHPRAIELEVLNAVDLNTGNIPDYKPLFGYELSFPVKIESTDCDCVSN